ncbi:MAG TPA: glutamate 5-kinase [Bacteroidales bacterium]|nr:glutamate 5-kinase [Bacteroidales bacterium]
MKTGARVFGRIAVKVGSNVITKRDGSLDTWRISRLVEDIFALYKKGIGVILVSSGAVAAGRNDITPTKKTNIMTARQVWAAIGQAKLISSYQYLFGKYGITAGQVLATKESFRDRMHYLNMKDCISAMLDNGVLPIVNENDTISVNELMFTDNDELSGLISSMMDCDALLILTNVDGLFTGEPGTEGTKLISEVEEGTGDLSKYLSATQSGSGRGGIFTKYNTARKLAAEGIDVYIANGSRDWIISDIIKGKDVPRTRFKGAKSKTTGIKKWIRHSESFARGSVTVDQGASEALLGDKASSLLVIGVVSVDGYFRKGDIISIIDENGSYIGLGKSELDSRKVESLIGQKLLKPLIHYDYLVINEKIAGPAQTFQG